MARNIKVTKRGRVRVSLDPEEALVLTALAGATTGKALHGFYDLMSDLLGDEEDDLAAYMALCEAVHRRIDSGKAPNTDEALAAFKAAYGAKA